MSLSFLLTKKKKKEGIEFADVIFPGMNIPAI
jgi:hypothetical protein